MLLKCDLGASEQNPIFRFNKDLVKKDSLEDLKVYLGKLNYSLLELTIVQPKKKKNLILGEKNLLMVIEEKDAAFGVVRGLPHFWSPDSFCKCQFSISHHCQEGMDACEM